MKNELKIKESFHKKSKFVDPITTANGEKRAYVNLKSLDTLWFNTGTLCNLSCENCYIESGPRNDSLVYLTTEDVQPFLDEIQDYNLGTKRISFTGGEPFLNKDMMPIIELCLSYGFEVSVLTNAYRAIDLHIGSLAKFNSAHPGKLFLRVSFDHYSEEIHEQERGPKTFKRTLKTYKKLYDLELNLSIAGRSLKDEETSKALSGYQNMLKENAIDQKVKLGESIVIFPEMSPDIDVPEITTNCWDILNKTPDQQMCSTERMIVKRKGETSPVVLPCTLLAYDSQFELGKTLLHSKERVQLNHPYCAQFCVLGGASCSST